MRYGEVEPDADVEAEIEVGVDESVEGEEGAGERGGRGGGGARDPDPPPGVVTVAVDAQGVDTPGRGGKDGDCVAGDGERIEWLGGGGRDCCS